MITAAYVQTMAGYNAEMNRRLYGAAARIPDAERRAERGVFWGSLHATLNHILWGDRAWMHRFSGSVAPAQTMAQGIRMFDDFDALAQARVETDTAISAWAAGLSDAWLTEDLAWFSGALGREICKPRWLLVSHLFNHQTHHRGQAHALVTAAGEQTGDTDLFILV